VVKVINAEIVNVTVIVAVIAVEIIQAAAITRAVLLILMIPLGSVYTSFML
jgi:hypothetical protein